jgi:hypothetical protein
LPAPPNKQFRNDAQCALGDYLWIFCQYTVTSGFWPRVRARALRAPVFLSSFPPQSGRCAPPPAHRIAALLILLAIIWGQIYVPVRPYALFFFGFFLFSIVFGSFLFVILFFFLSFSISSYSSLLISSCSSRRCYSSSSYSSHLIF